MEWRSSCQDWLAAAMREYQDGNIRLAVIATYNSVAEACEMFMRETDPEFSPEKFFNFEISVSKLRRDAGIDDAIEKGLINLQKARNKAVHYPYSAPPRSDVQDMITTALDTLLIFRVESPLTTARLDGMYFTVAWPSSETVRVARFQTDESGFTALCPVDWEDVSEDQDYVRFATYRGDWKHSHDPRQESQDVYPYKTTQKILTFRRFSSGETSSSIGVEDFVRQDIPLSRDSKVEVFKPLRIPDLRVAKATETPEKKHRTGVSRETYYVIESSNRTSWRGSFQNVILSEGNGLTVGFHQLMGFRNSWESMLQEIMRSLDSVPKRESPPDRVAEIIRTVMIPSLGGEHNLRVAWNEQLLAVGVDPIGEVRAHVIVRDATTNKVLRVALLEGQSTVVRGKVLRWNRLGQFADEVHIYVPAEFADGIREWRQEVGLKTHIFSLRYEKATNVPIVEKVEL